MNEYYGFNVIRVIEGGTGDRFENHLPASSSCNIVSRLMPDTKEIGRFEYRGI